MMIMNMNCGDDNNNLGLSFFTLSISLIEFISVLTSNGGDESDDNDIDLYVLLILLLLKL